MSDMSGKNRRKRADGRISIRVPTELRLEIRSIATARGKGDSTIVREVLKEYFQAVSGRETCLELARKGGLIGSVKNLPRDFSTNPRQFRGFGR